MRRSLPLLFLLLTAMLPSCQETVQFPARLEVGQENLSTDAFSGEATIGFTSTQPWTASVDGEWCKVIPGSGNGGPASTGLHILFDDNMSPSERSCTVTIRSGGLEKTVTVRQGHRDILINDYDYYITDEAQTLEIRLLDSGGADIEVDGAYRDWMRIIDTKSMESTVIVLSISRNTSRARTGIIHIRCGSQNETISVHQGPSDIILSDESLNRHCHSSFDYDMDGCLSIDEALGIKDLGHPVRDYQDLMHFPGLESLYYWARTEETLDFHMLPALKDLTVRGPVIGLDLAYNPLLEGLSLSETLISGLNLSVAPLLERLSVSSSPGFERLELSGMDALRELSVQKDDGLKALLLSGCGRLEKIDVRECDSLNSIDLSRSPNVKSIDLYYLLGLNRFILGNQPDLIDLTGVSVYLSETLDLSGCQGLKTLSWSGSQISGILFPESSALETLMCSWNQLTSLDVSPCSSLKDLIADHNKLETVTLDRHPELEYINLSENELTSFTIDGCTNLNSLYLSYNKLNELHIENAEKLQHFDCSTNTMTELSVINCPELVYFVANYCGISSLVVRDNMKLSSLHCSQNHLESTSVSGCPNLNTVEIRDNDLEVIDLSDVPGLKDLWCSRNRLRSLDVSSCPLLQVIRCDSNKLETLDLTKNPDCHLLWCNLNPDLETVYLIAGNEYELSYDPSITTIVYL